MREEVMQAMKDIHTPDTPPAGFQLWIEEWKGLERIGDAIERLRSPDHKKILLIPTASSSLL